MPWKNGLGTTTEIARFPRDGEFDWRISVADVATDGPFSKFPGCERVILTLEGAGMILTHAEPATAATIGPLEPWSFSGDWTTDCLLRDGPIRDFNVIARRGAFITETSVLRVDARTTLPANADVIASYCVEGAVRVHGCLLATGETLVATRSDEEGTIDIEPVTRAILVVVRLTSLGEHRQLA